MRIVFLGTPDFAVPQLMALHAAGYEIAGVFTQPNRPSGRGQKMVAPEVKAAAEALGLPVFQPKRIKGKKGVETLRALSPEMIVTAAFGQILSQEVLDIPRLGTVNVHASLLPKYRGAAPINRCIAAGETVSGVTTMYTDIGIDTGDMIYQRETLIGPEETAGELSVRLAEIGAELIVKTLKDIEAGIAPRVPQDEKLASYQPMLSRDDGRIDWGLTAWEICCHVRGMTPWPSAWTDTGDGRMKVWKCTPETEVGIPGRILSASAQEGLLVGCKDGSVRIEELQAPGKKRMRAGDYLRGYRGEALAIGKDLE